MINTGDTAWMLISTGLVLLMMPGLALFYGGLVRTKNVLSTFMHSFVVLGLVTLQWVLFGYSLAYGPSNPARASWRRPSSGCVEKVQSTVARSSSATRKPSSVSASTFAVLGSSRDRRLARDDLGKKTLGMGQGCVVRSVGQTWSPDRKEEHTCKPTNEP